LAFALVAIFAASALSMTVLGANTPSLWAVEQVNAAIAENLVPPSLQSNYTQAITRAEFCALAVALYEAFRGEITGRISFSDTTDINVEKAAYIGVVSGMEDNNFNPNGTLTREQAAVMLARLAYAAEEPLRHGRNLVADFTDSHEIAAWAVESIDSIVSAGIMGGVDDYRFAPRQTYTREQSIVSIMRLFTHVQIRNVDMPTPGELGDNLSWSSRSQETTAEIEGPRLYVGVGTAQRVPTIRGVTNWHVILSDGTGTGFLSDSLHSLQLSQDDLVPTILHLENEYNEIHFHFSSPPQTVSVQRWDVVYSGIANIDDATAENVPVDGTTIRVTNESSHIYEVHATWEEGFALFTFRTRDVPPPRLPSDTSDNEPRTERVTLVSNGVVHQPGVHFIHGGMRSGDDLLSASGIPFEAWLRGNFDEQPVIPYSDDLQIIIDGEGWQVITFSEFDPTHYNDFALMGIYAESFIDGVATVSLPDHESGSYLVYVDIHWSSDEDNWSRLRYVFKIVK